MPEPRDEIRPRPRRRRGPRAPPVAPLDAAPNEGDVAAVLPCPEASKLLAFLLLSALKRCHARPRVALAPISLSAQCDEATFRAAFGQRVVRMGNKLEARFAGPRGTLDLAETVGALLPWVVRVHGADVNATVAWLAPPIVFAWRPDVLDNYDLVTRARVASLHCETVTMRFKVDREYTTANAQLRLEGIYYTRAATAAARAFSPFVARFLYLRFFGTMPFHLARSTLCSRCIICKHACP